MREGKRKRRHVPVRLVALIGGTALLVIALSAIDLRPDLSRLDTKIASGAEQGNYHAIVEHLANAARVRNGTIENVSSSGTVDNLKQLVAAKDTCEIEFALVQDGVRPEEAQDLFIIARLPKSESVFFLGKHASSLSRFSHLRGLRIGVGPVDSGTDHLSRRIFEAPDLSSLGITLTNQPLLEQLDALEDGRLDLAVFVVDEDADLIREAILERGLTMASFEHLDVIARRFPFVSHGRIAAGQFDPVAVVPPQDLRVLRVDTLIVGNGCAKRSEILGLWSLVDEAFVGALQHTRSHGRSEFFTASEAARSYVVNEGPLWTDAHLPWLVDIMPIDNWLYVVMGISVLFNVMGTGHRFRLWRIDANRVKALTVFHEILGDTITPAEIYKLTPTEEHRSPESVARIDEALVALDVLRARCRKAENSMLVPMSEEWAYRYQEEQMEQYLGAVRDFRQRVKRPTAQEE